MTDTRNELPGSLDSRRVGLLGWNEKPLTLKQDFVSLELEPEKQTASGILIVKSEQRRGLAPATIIATGPGRHDKKGRLIPMNVKAGDRVLVGADCGWEYGKYRIIRQGAIDGIIADDT